MSGDLSDPHKWWIGFSNVIPWTFRIYNWWFTTVSDWDFLWEKSILLDTIVCVISCLYLAGGFNPFEKYARQIGNLPQVGMKIKKKWNHHLVMVGKWKNILSSIPLPKGNAPMQLVKHGLSRLTGQWAIHPHLSRWAHMKYSGWIDESQLLLSVGPWLNTETLDIEG